MPLMTYVWTDQPDVVRVEAVANLATATLSAL